MNSNGTMANSSKKRKASELDSDFETKTPKSKARSRSKGHKNSAKATDEIPFKPECPYKPSAKANDDVFVEKEQIAPGFEFEYGVRPGLEWKEMRTYRNVKLQDHTFSVGNMIYINKQNPPPKSPRPDATDAEMLKYDRSNFWVARIADTRAISEKAVFLRVYWLYWPEELPMGRQPYHGDRELVQSNAMDIVDAQTISGAADLTYWDEKELNSQYRDRFWRQTFDISKLGKDRKGGLSELRRHCRCNQPHNPDKTMFQCKKPSCLTWNHEGCLANDALQRAWPVFRRDGNLDAIEGKFVKTEGGDGESSLRDRLLTPVRQLGKIVQSRMTPTMNTVIEQSVPHTTDRVTNGIGSSSKKNKPTKKAAKSNNSEAPPWEGKLRAQIIDSDEKDDDGPIHATVEEVVGKKSKSETTTWSLRVNCLVCGHTI